MGLTESNSNRSRIEQNYKLIRRYTSQCYGDLTVVQHKQTKDLYALKQIITENNYIMRLIQKRHQLSHKSLVSLEKFCCTGDQSLCSSLRNYELLFKYYPRTLDEQMQHKIQQGQSFSDIDIAKICTQSIDCLKYLQNNQIMHLLGNMKSLLYDGNTRTVKIIQNQQNVLFAKNRNQINIISFVTNKKMLPLHPSIQPKDSSEMAMNINKIIYQNLFVIGLIALGLCFMREPIELGIFGKTSYNFQKIKKRVNQIKQKYPRTHKIINILLLNSEIWASYSQALIIISEDRKSFSKQNQRGLRLTDQPLQKSDLFQQGKKLSKLRQLKRNRLKQNNQFIDH